MDKQFNIPLNKEELLNSNSEFYYVEKIIPSTRISNELKNCRQSLKNEGPDFIFDHFPIYFSIIYNHDEVSNDIFMTSISDISQALKLLSNNLEFLLKEDEVDREVLDKNLNILKMLTYLFSKTVTKVEDIIKSKQKQEALLKTKKTKKNAIVDISLDKLTILNLINELLSKSLQRLWDPPTCEEAFINLIVNILFVFMENVEMKNDTDMANFIFNIFGILLKEHNYSTTFTLRLVSLIKSKENDHLATIVPQGIAVLVNDFNCKGLVHQLIKELTEWQIEEENVQDAPASRNCCAILINLVPLVPDLLMNDCRYLIEEGLANDPYTLRICVLTIITDLLLIMKKDVGDGVPEDVVEEQKKTMDMMFEQLTIHIRDVNALVRSKVLQLWGRLYSEVAVPLEMLNAVLEKIIGRLQDKAVLVRKYACNLVTTFVECNPFSATLRLDEAEKQLIEDAKKLSSLKDATRSGLFEKLQKREEQWQKIEAEIRQVISTRIFAATQISREDGMELDNASDLDYRIRTYLEEGKYLEAFTYCHLCEGKIEGMKDARKGLSDEQQVEFYVTLLHKIYCDMKDEVELADAAASNNSEMQLTERRVKYDSDLVQFLQLLHRAVPLSIDLLRSASKSDVIEAIRFFIVAHKFELKDNDKGLEVMLDILRTNEKEVQAAVVSAYKELFLENIDSKKESEYAASVVERLTKVMGIINIDSINSFSTIISEWVKTGLVNAQVINYLFKVITGVVEDATPFDKRASLQLLGFVATGRPTLIDRNVDVIVKAAFVENGKKDAHFAAIACKVLSQYGNKTEKSEENEAPPPRKPNDDPMWMELSEILRYHFEKMTNGVLELGRHSVSVIYKLCRSPDLLCEKILTSLYEILTKETEMNNLQLSFFIYMLGEVALQQFMYLDVVVYKELKRRAHLREKTSKGKKGKNTVNVTSASERSKTNTTDMDESFMEGAQAYDAEADFIYNICEKELVNANYLGQFGPILYKILKNPDIYNDQRLQSATALTMTRYMIVSSQLCKKFMPFIMTVLDTTPFPGVKKNIIQNFAHLLNRFPNILEPLTNDFYKCVRDPDESVRHTAIIVLCNLIRQNVLRVRGIIAEVARCVNDPNRDVVRIVEECFQSVSGQNSNAIYNALSDIISHLNNEENCSEDEFRTDMTFVMKHIDKNKQMETLVGTLCSRICATDDERQMHNVSYCLTLINHNEKSIAKLIDLYPTYKNRLDDQVLHHVLISIVEKHKNSPKEEMKKIVHSFDEILRTGKTNDGESEFDKNEDKQKQTRNKKQSRTKKRRS